MRLTQPSNAMVSLALLASTFSPLLAEPPTVSAEERCDCGAVRPKPIPKATDQPYQATLVADVVAVGTITSWDARTWSGATLNVTSASNNTPPGFLEVRIPESTSACGISLEPAQTYRLEVSFGFRVPPWTDACHSIERQMADGTWLRIAGPYATSLLAPPFPFNVVAMLGSGIAGAALLLTTLVFVFRPRAVTCSRRRPCAQAGPFAPWR